MHNLNVCGDNEQLYLCKKKGEQDIFVEGEVVQYLRQFQIDGIRFIYNQFCKDGPGIILNDPPLYGKTVQVVLFLSAIISSAQSFASLIICENENTVHYWKYHFHLWANQIKDSIAESNNIFAKKNVFITSVNNADNYSRKKWSAVVVDDVDPVKHKKYLKKIDGKFTIWLTSKELCSDLPTFTLIYKWIYPDSNIDLNTRYSTSNVGTADAIKKIVALDKFCENVLIRRNCENEMPLVSNEISETLFREWSENNNIVFQNLAPIKRKKDKDITGLKIKKTRKAAVKNTLVEPIDNTLVKTEKVSYTNNDVRDILSASKTDTSEESFNSSTSSNINKISKIVDKLIDESNTINSPMDIDGIGNIQNVKDSDKNTSMDIEEDTKDNISNIKEISNDVTGCDSDSEMPSFSLKYSADESMTCSDGNRRDLNNLEEFSFKDHSNTEDDAIYDRDTELLIKEEEEIKYEENILKPNSEIPTPTTDNNIPNPIKGSISPENDISVNIANIEKEIRGSERESDESVNTLDIKQNINTFKTKDIKEMVKIIEEESLKKFKGSILDSLF